MCLLSVPEARRWEPGELGARTTWRQREASVTEPGLPNSMRERSTSAEMGQMVTSLNLYQPSWT